MLNMWFKCRFYRIFIINETCLINYVLDIFKHCLNDIIFYIWSYKYKASLALNNGEGQQEMNCLFKILLALPARY